MDPLVPTQTEPVMGKLLAPPKPVLCAGWNIILSADFYKGGHHALLNPKLEYVYHYLESRGGEFDQVVCAGASFVAKVFSEYTLTYDHIKDAERTSRYSWEGRISKIGATVVVT